MASSSATTGLRPLLMQAAQAAADHIEGLSQRSVAPTAAALAALEEMGSEIPLRGRDPKELMAELFFVQESIGDSLIFASTETKS